MICFSLVCENGHDFEGWFPDNARFEQQAEKKLLSCPFCGSADVRKAIMAPAVHSRRSEKSEMPATPAAEPEAKPTEGTNLPAKTPPAPVKISPEQQQKMMMAYALMRRVQTYVENNFENVGRKLPEEARKIHHGESEERPIYGEATLDEAKELHEEGIEVQPLPLLPKHDA